jgi:murein DD-endopeptidase MepM/ murein hydrolase activator NlpD
MLRIRRLRDKLRHRKHQRERQTKKFKSTHLRGHAKLAKKAARQVRYLKHLIRRWKRSRHSYGAGGWAPTKTWWIQRVDQGQDFEIPLGERVRAPGDGEVIGHGEDKAFPYGFGHHLIVRIDNGRFGGREYYIGHVEGLVDDFPVGHRFKKGDLLSRTNHYLNAGRGWVELGTYPYGPMGTGWNIHSLFTTVTE